jgi:hypothetical protein
MPRMSKKTPTADEIAEIASRGEDLLLRALNEERESVVQFRHHGKVI